MPLAAAIIPAVASLGSAAVGAFAGGRTTTSQSQPTLSPKLQALQNDTADSLDYNLRNPTAQTDALKIPAMEAINSRYAAAPTALAAALGKRGFGSSGAAGGAYYGLETSRLGDLSNLEGTLAATNIQNQQSNLGLAERLTTAGAGSSSRSVGPNNGPANGLSTLTTLFALNKLLKGNGAGGPSYAEQGVETTSLPTDGSPGDWGGEYTGSGD
jgi:hypothetical protein